MANDEVAARSQLWKHEALVEWITEKHGVDFSKLTPVEIVAVSSKWKATWRRSPEYTTLVEVHREESKVAAAARREERKATKASEKATESGEKVRPATRAAKAAKPATKAAAVKAAKPARKTATKKSATTPAKTAAARKGRATRATKPTTDVDPFG